jgi:hypothetical protein
MCCDTGLPNYDSLINAFQHNPKTKYFFENRGTYPITEKEINYSPLNTLNFSQAFPISNFIYANSTIEPINV